VTATRSRTARRAHPAVLVACLTVVGCDAGGEAGAPERPEDAAVPATPAVELTRAVYRTELTFVGRGRPPAVLHLRFENVVDSSEVRLRYRGWIAGQAWSPILDVRGALPVPRAAWRVLPVGSLRVAVGEGGDLASVILERDDGIMRLDSWGLIGSWNSSTGQRESLRIAELTQGSGGDSGLLLSRQAARPTDDPPPVDTGQLFLVTDTLGNGILLLRDSTLPDTPVTAWTWFEESQSEWSDALILSLAASPGSPGRWSIELPEAGLLGELRAVAPQWSDPEDDGTRFEMFRIEGTLVMAGEPWSVSGMGIQESGP